jgi:hypothetical protein
MVRAYLPHMMDDDNDIEIVKAVISREPEPRPPEWVSYPGVKVKVIRRWRIVRNHRRTFVVIVVINHGWV